MANAIATVEVSTVQTTRPKKPTVSRYIPYFTIRLILRIIQACFALSVLGLSAKLLVDDATNRNDPENMYYLPKPTCQNSASSNSIYCSTDESPQESVMKINTHIFILLVGAIFTSIVCVFEFALLCSFREATTKFVGISKSMIYLGFVFVDLAIIFILIIGVVLVAQYITHYNMWSKLEPFGDINQFTQNPSFTKGCFVMGFLMILSFAMTAMLAYMLAAYSKRKEKLQASEPQFEHDPNQGLRARDEELLTEGGSSRNSMTESELARDEEQRELDTRYFLHDVISVGPDNARTPQRGYLNVLNGALCRQAAKGIRRLARHRDALGRVRWIRIYDSYIHASTGRVKQLIVQANDAIYNGPATRCPRTWDRTFIRPAGAYALRVANWPFVGFQANRGLWSEKDGIGIALRWIPACLITCFCLPFARTEAVIRPEGKYRDFPYRYWTYPHVSRNPKEDCLPRHIKTSEEEDGLSYFYSEAKHERILRPRLLCYLRNPESKDMHGVEFLSSEEDDELPKERRGKPYMFVAYTMDQFSHDSPGDVDCKALSQIAERATRDAGLSAYWVASSCFAREEYIEDDIYRISDVIRGAHSVVVALGQPCDSRVAPNEIPREKTADELLKDWGRRMWTFPEALLCPSSAIEIYLRTGDTEWPIAHVETISKKDFPARAWHDKLISRQLMDHFEGNLALSRLEIVVIALECLRGRKTTEGRKGDLSYVLMGLLRRRPKPNENDSAFQAFARLSLSNDNDRYLERLICVQPTGTAVRDRTGNELLTAKDVWGCCLWDIYPLCQVAAIGHGDSVILDGCSGAAIKWDRFESPARIRGYSFRRFFTTFWLRLCPFLFIVGAIITGLIPSFGEALGGVFLGLSSLTIFFYPILIIKVHSGKVWDTQAELFGFEGYLDIRTIECLIWGFNDERLKWSICGSSLSRHSYNADKECVGRDPTDDPDIKNRVKEHERDHKRIFTIVDTKTMQVSLIEAVHPPVLALACGKEGGMVRTVLCSFDYKTNTVYREAVLRMESRVLTKMNHIGRICFGVRRPAEHNPTVASKHRVVPTQSQKFGTPEIPAAFDSRKAMGKAIKSGFEKWINSLTPENSPGTISYDSSPPDVEQQILPETPQLTPTVAGPANFDSREPTFNNQPGRTVQTSLHPEIQPYIPPLVSNTSNGAPRNTTTAFHADGS
ncbi:hypothetical protein BDD12DRAFT_927945 [Trichophaea hybrida]|nr:hypothetical protein BDD12DRAFT_927945 [Trichophaea hybrida]